VVICGVQERSGDWWNDISKSMDFANNDSVIPFRSLVAVSDRMLSLLLSVWISIIKRFESIINRPRQCNCEITLFCLLYHSNRDESVSNFLV
jgi:hypothetical protein